MINIHDLPQEREIVEISDIEAAQITGGKDPRAFAQKNAEFQAESQIFKMFQESISTVIKSIGEGMSSVARKS